MKYLLLLLLLSSILLVGCSSNTNHSGTITHYTQTNFCTFGSNAGLIMNGRLENLTNTQTNITINDCCCMGKVGGSNEFYCMCKDLDTLKLVR